MGNVCIGWGGLGLVAIVGKGTESCAFSSWRRSFLAVKFLICSSNLRFSTWSWCNDFSIPKTSKSFVWLSVMAIPLPWLRLYGHSINYFRNEMKMWKFCTPNDWALFLDLNIVRYECIHKGRLFLDVPHWRFAASIDQINRIPTQSSSSRFLSSEKKDGILFSSRTQTSNSSSINKTQACHQTAGKKPAIPAAQPVSLQAPQQGALYLHPTTLFQEKGLIVNKLPALPDHLRYCVNSSKGGTSSWQSRALLLGHNDGHFKNSRY